MVSKIESYVLLYLQPPFGQAISKKAGKKVAATPKKGGRDAVAKGKVTKVRMYLNIRAELMARYVYSVPVGGLERRFIEKVGWGD